MIDDKFVQDDGKLFDFFKHLTTLNTGSILIILTFLEESMLQLDFWTVGFAFVGFIISLILSVYIMFFIAYLPEKYWKHLTPKKESMAFRTYHFLIFVSICCFLFGIVFLVYSINFAKMA